MNIVLTLLLPALYWTGDNTDLPSSRNISKAVKVNLAFIVPFFKKKGKLSCDIEIDRLHTCGSVKFVGLLEFQKVSFSLFPVLKGWLCLGYVKVMLPSKRENLSRCSPKLIHVCKKLPLALDCRQIKFSLWIYNIHIFSILGVAFAVSFLCYFQKHQLLVVKKINNFCCIVFLFVWAEKIISQIFNIYFRLEILTFLSSVVSVSLYMFN